VSKLKYVAAPMVATLIAATASAAGARAATGPTFARTPEIAYSGNTVSVVARLDRALTNISTAGFVADSSLKAGQKIGDSFGGNAPGRIGSASRHCYLAEAIQPKPRAKLHAGAHWRLGLIAKEERVLHTHAITLHHATPGGDWPREAARRLGCY
jgi:hypothetical protein